MSDDVVISVENISKKYCTSLKHSMIHGVSDIGRNLFGLSSHSENLRADEFWAVDDVSFELRKGEALGLIGQNGSGKSTLLKMLNGIFWPDKGKITIKGRVGALIEVGAGFHPLLTGRENVYLNGAILGMTKAEVNAKFDDIVEFADIGDFIDVPVKSYSSGMYVRLGFAVAVHSSPDILLVDEVLAVGDYSFEKRCLRRLSDMRKDCAVVLVSHNVNLIRFTASKVVFLNKGKTQFIGSASEGVAKYIEYMEAKNLQTKNKFFSQSKFDAKIELKSISLFDKNQNEVSEVIAGEPLIIECVLNAIKPIRQALIGFSFYKDYFERSFDIYSSDVSSDGHYDLDVGTHKCRIIIPEINLNAGTYDIGVGVSEENKFAQHAWIHKVIVVKNIHPEFGSYDMKVKFYMDNSVSLHE